MSLHFGKYSLPKQARLTKTKTCQNIDIAQSFLESTFTTYSFNKASGVNSVACDLHSHMLSSQSARPGVGSLIWSKQTSDSTRKKLATLGIFTPVLPSLEISSQLVH